MEWRLRNSISNQLKNGQSIRLVAFVIPKHAHLVHPGPAQVV